MTFDATSGEQWRAAQPPLLSFGMAQALPPCLEDTAKVIGLSDALRSGRPMPVAVKALPASAPRGALVGDPRRPPVATPAAAPIEKVTTRCGGHWRPQAVPLPTPTRWERIAGAP